MKKILILRGGFRGFFCAIQDSLALKIQGKSFKLLDGNDLVIKNYFGDYLPRTFKKLNLNED